MAAAPQKAVLGALVVTDVPAADSSKLCELVTVCNDGGWREEIEIEMRRFY